MSTLRIPPMTAMKGSGQSGVIHATRPEKASHRQVRVPDSLRPVPGRTSLPQQDEPPAFDPTESATAAAMTATSPAATAKAAKAARNRKSPVSLIAGAVLLLGGIGGAVAWQLTHTPKAAPAATVPAVSQPAPTPAPAVYPTGDQTPVEVPSAQDSTPHPWRSIINLPEINMTETPVPETNVDRRSAPAGNHSGTSDWAKLLEE